MRFTKIGFVGVAVVAGLALVTPASADPSKEGTTDVICDHLGRLTLNNSPGDGKWTPALVVGSNLVLTPYEFHFVQVFDPVGPPPPETYYLDQVKVAPKNGRLDSCTVAEQTFTDLDGNTFTFSGTAKVSYTKG